jgi:hypothetical protein
LLSLNHLTVPVAIVFSFDVNALLRDYDDRVIDMPHSGNPDSFSA